MSTQELIKQVLAERGRLIEQHRTLVDEVEQRGDGWTGEDDVKHSRLSEQIDMLKKRAEALHELEESKSSAEAQRAPFERMIRSDRDPFAQEPDGIVRQALRGQGPTSFYADFRNLSHRVEPDGRLVIETHDLTKLTDAAGDYTVPQSFLAELFRHLVENTAVRAAGARQITTPEGRDLLVPKTTDHGGAALVTEGAAIQEDDAVFGQATLGAYKYGQLIQISNELATDTGVDLDGYLAESAGSNLGLASGAHFVTGTNSGQPDGVAITPVVGKTGATGTATSVTGDDLIDTFHSVVSGYRVNGSWLMRDATLASIRKIKTGESGSVQYLWKPGLEADAPDTILGRPVFTDPNVPAMAANAYSILFGDFSRHYVIRDVRGVRFERSTDYAFANDQITFRALLRTDGERVDLNAVKAFRNAAS